MATEKHFAVDISCGFLDPQARLAAALAQRNLRDFCIALDMGAEATLQDERHVSVFEKALQTHGCAAYVEECLRRDCSPNYINQQLNKTAINFAADSRDPQTLTALLRHRGIQVDHKYAQLTPLNSLAKNLTAENAADVMACMQLLLNYGASANVVDQREMTPLHYVLKNRKLDDAQKRQLIQIFLDYAADLDVDSYRDGEVRHLLQSEYSDLKLPPVRSSAAAEVTLDTLLSHLRSGNEQRFLQQFGEYQLNISGKDNLVNATQEQNIQLLVEAVKRGLQDAFDAIVEAGVNINLLYNGNSAVEIAAIWGNWSALQKLLDHADLQLRPQDQLLSTVIKKLDEPLLNGHCDYVKCFFVLLNNRRVDVNEADPSGSTPLHYAVKYRNRMAIKELLKRGAYIGQKSAFGDLPIDGISAELLEEHLDACITTNGLKAGDESFEILMNYMNLMPPQRPLQGKSAAATPTPRLREEMTPITFIADSKEHRHLLQHPLITSFLFLKWHRLSVVFYVNFFLYTFFAASIVVHTILKFRESEHEAITTLFGVFAWIGIVYMGARELLQLSMAPAQYFRSPINYMEIALIWLATMTCIESNYDRETHRVIAVFTILLVALELCLLVGSLPVLSISTHMLMLRAVSTSFLKSFTLYSIFVITFSLCFYILFGKPGLDESGSPVPSEEGEFNKFTNPFAAVIKTIVMLTGEFDAGDIDFDTLYSYLIFLLFVFFMSIVLFNLLNGLAVSDTQAIKAQAELNGSICRTNLLARYEEVLTGRSGRANFIVQHEPFRSVCRRLMNLYPTYIGGRKIAILPNDGNKVLIPVANSYEMKAIPQQQRDGAVLLSPTASSCNEEPQKKLLDPPVQLLPCCCCCSCITGRCSQMDSRTVKLAMAVIEQKAIVQHERQRVQTTERRLQSIEEKLSKMFELLQDMRAN